MGALQNSSAHITIRSTTVIRRANMNEILTDFIPYRMKFKSLRHLRPIVQNGNKTVQHQDISEPVEKDSSAPRQFGIKTNRYRDKSAPHFLSNKREMQSKHN